MILLDTNIVVAFLNGDNSILNLKDFNKVPSYRSFLKSWVKLQLCKPDPSVSLRKVV